MRLRRVFRHIRQAESLQRRVEHPPGAVEHELAFDAHFQCALAFLEFSRGKVVDWKVSDGQYTEASQ